jgi:hypothetical protein
MIESYGKVTALDGSEYVYTDFKDSRKEAVARDQAILAVREQQKGRPLTIRERLEPATQEEMPPSKPAADAAKPSPTGAGIKLPYPLTAPARALTPGEESAKKMFMEAHVAAARAQAKPVAYKTLRSYIRWAPTVEYVRKVMLPSLRRRHASIWSRTTSQPK